MRLETLCFSAGLETPSDTRVAACEISAIVMDSRAVVPGCMFICIRGTAADGHAFIEEALQRGAAAVVTEREVPVMKGSGAVFIRVPDTRRASARLYDAWYGHPAKEMKLIAVTGTNGKTSVSTMLKAILDAAMVPCGLIGTVRCVCRDRELHIRSSNPNANMTTPDPAELYHILSVMQGEGVEVVVMEATSHALALQKLEPLCFEAAIFTNLTPEHLDFHQTMQDYFAAKASLFTKAKLSILNADDAAARDLIPYCKGRVCLTSAGGHAVDYVATGVEFRGTRGVSYTMRAPHAAVQLSSPIPGIFTLSNTLQAAACAMELGIGARSVREGIGTLGGVKGRMEKVKLDVPLEIDVFLDYAHTPDALENVLRTARGFCRRNQRVVVLFGCGGDRDRSKRPRMGEIASRYADMIYITSDNSRSERPQDIIANILEGISPQKDYKVIPDRALAIETAVLGAQRGDVIILAGKGHEAYEIDQTGKHPFDEKAIVRAAARRAYDWAHQQNKNEGE